jgi:signal transduction histidine kinase
MKRCCVAVVVLALAGFARANENGEKQVNDCVKLVKRAARLIEQQGEKAFDTFRTQGSDFFQGETYVFVKDTNGRVLVHPVDRNLEGKNDLDLKDIDGRPFGQLTLESTDFADGQGWSHYKYHEPGNTTPVWKSTFCVRTWGPDGTEYIVGSGVYNVGAQRAFIKDTVSKAAALVEEEGPAAFDEFRNRKGLFFYGDTYVFVLTEDGTELVNAAFPKLEGRNLLDLKDANGQFPVRALFERLENAESGSEELMWPKPGQTTPSRKEIFFRRVEFGGENYIVGSGLYLD